MSRDESRDHEIDVSTDSCIRYYDTGAGYLVFKVRLEYHAEIERWFPVEHELLGVSGIEDRATVEAALRDLGVNRTSVRHLPEYSIADSISDRDA